MIGAQAFYDIKRLARLGNGCATRMNTAESIEQLLTDVVEA